MAADDDLKDSDNTGSATNQSDKNRGGFANGDGKSKDLGSEEIDPKKAQAEIIRNIQIGQDRSSNDRDRRLQDILNRRTASPSQPDRQNLNEPPVGPRSQPRTQSQQPQNQQASDNIGNRTDIGLNQSSKVPDNQDELPEEDNGENLPQGRQGNLKQQSPGKEQVQDQKQQVETDKSNNQTGETPTEPESKQQAVGGSPSGTLPQADRLFTQNNPTGKNRPVQPLEKPIGSKLPERPDSSNAPSGQRTEQRSGSGQSGGATKNSSDSAASSGAKTPVGGAASGATTTKTAGPKGGAPIPGASDIKSIIESAKTGNLDPEAIITIAKLTPGIGEVVIVIERIEKFPFLGPLLVKILGVSLKRLVAAIAPGVEIGPPPRINPAKVDRAEIARIIGRLLFDMAALVVINIVVYVVMAIFALIFFLIIFCQIATSTTLGSLASDAAAYIGKLTGNKELSLCHDLDVGFKSVQNFAGVGGGGGNYGGPISTGKYKELVNTYSQKYGLDACVLDTILRKESSGGIVDAIGHDHHDKKSDAVEKNNPPPQYYDPSNPPLFGLDWNYSHGIGLTQITIFPYSKSPNDWLGPNSPARLLFGTRYSVNDLLNPNTNMDIAAHYMKTLIDQKNGDIQAAFGAYNGSGTNGDYATDAIRLYNQCKAQPPQ